ncbi:PadR family transcriptional regulator [Eubacteriaceae bacterium ES2]|nr:PadR family transcriptional regulator [Eubacteriaceae bacterium ES2]
MRTLKYAILGLINRESITGYDLSKVFNKDLVNFWYANHSQIYPELKKLTAEGLITYEIVLQGEKLEKKLYSITAAGQQDLYAWLATIDPLEPTPKDIFRLKAFFMETLPVQTILDHFESQLSQRLEKVAKLENTMSSQAFFLKKDSRISPEFCDYLVLKGAIMREKTYIKWLEECIAEIGESS